MIRKKENKKLITVSLLSVILCVIVSVISGCVPDNRIPEGEKMIIGTTIVPLKTLIEAVTGDLAEIEILVPPGASPESYEPSPAKISRLSRASVFFSIDLPPEAKLDREVFADTVFVDLADIVSEKLPDRYFDEESHEDDTEEEGHRHTGRDPHIWLSPARAVIMVEAVAGEMKFLDPLNSETYDSNAAKYILKLEKLDNEISEKMNGLTMKKIIVFHPSLGYFADDYGLEMLALEDEGKEATAGHLTDMVDIARRDGISVIFTQAENAGMQPKVFADEIGGRVEVLEPLSGDYINNLYEIASKIVEAANG